MAKTKVTLWVEPEYAEKLQALARLEGLAVSQYGAVLLERGIKQANDSVGLDLLETRLKVMMSKEFDAMSKAIEKLLVYTAVESGITNHILRTDKIELLGKDAELERYRSHRLSVRKRVYKSSLSMANLLPQEAPAPKPQEVVTSGNIQGDVQQVE